MAGEQAPRPNWVAAEMAALWAAAAPSPPADEAAAYAVAAAAEMPDGVAAQCRLCWGVDEPDQPLFSGFCRCPGALSYVHPACALRYQRDIFRWHPQGDIWQLPPLWTPFVAPCAFCRAPFRWNKGRLARGSHGEALLERIEINLASPGAAAEEDADADDEESRALRAARTRRAHVRAALLWAEGGVTARQAQRLGVRHPPLSLLAAYLASVLLTLPAFADGRMSPLWAAGSGLVLLVPLLLFALQPFWALRRYLALRRAALLAGAPFAAFLLLAYVLALLARGAEQALAATLVEAIVVLVLALYAVRVVASCGALVCCWSSRPGWLWQRVPPTWRARLQYAQWARPLLVATHCFGEDLPDLFPRGFGRPAFDVEEAAEGGALDRGARAASLLSPDHHRSAALDGMRAEAHAPASPPLYAAAAAAHGPPVFTID